VTDDQPREARILSWHGIDGPVGECLVPLELIDMIVNAYENMGFTVKVTEYLPNSNSAT
jgi:hypothetical protein